MRLIDADALNLNDLPAVYGSEGTWVTLEDVGKKIDTQPTIEAVPVRHGKWIEQWRTADTRMLRCSECKMVFNVGNGREGNYCPNCGARMVEDE